MLTPEYYKHIVDMLWEANREGSKNLAESVAKDNSLPGSALVLLPGLSKLMAELQYKSFIMGAASALTSIEMAGVQITAARNLGGRALKVALTFDEPVDVAKVLEVWAKSVSFAGLDLCVCACGNPVTTVHIKRIAHLPEEIEMFCDNCSPVIFLSAPRIKL